MAGGEARRRGLFQPAPLRRRLRQEYNIILGEPPEWGLIAYRAAIKQLSRIEIPGLGLSGPAEKMFVWPRARPYDRSRRTDFEDEDPTLADQQTEGIVDLRSFPGDELDRVVVVAGPGYGKSALLTAIASDLAEGPMVPVHVPLASFASADSSIIGFLGTTISQEMDLSADWQRLAEQGLLVLLFDGLDEVPSGERPTLMQRIATFSARYPQAPWILTVRDAAVVTGLPEARIVELLALDDEDIERFAVTMQEHLGELRSWQLVRRLKLYPDLERLARIPLFLVMLIATMDLSTATALTRSDLIEAYLGTLFAPGRFKSVRDPTDRSLALRRVAELLAFERLERQEIGATEREVRAVVGRVAASADEATHLFEQLIANGILKPQSAIRLQFPYPIVQEYLAARHLVDHYPETLAQRIEDAVQRPWAQVIQFAIELHPEPEPIVQAMLARPDDAFCTGLRLVGRCIANGAAVGEQLRTEVGDRLVEYWIHAPSRSRERVGRLLADGFSTPPSAKLVAALPYRWLIEDGAGDIVSKIGDIGLTCRILAQLIEADSGSIRIYHSLKPALRQAGDAALKVVVDALDPATREADTLEEISSLFNNFTSRAVSRNLALSVARDGRLPDQTRLRAYALAGRPLEPDGIDLALAGLRHDDWGSHYEARDLVEAHEDPIGFLRSLLRDNSIPIKRRGDLAAQVATLIKDTSERALFLEASILDQSLDPEVKVTLQLFAARYGDRQAMEQLVEQIGTLPLEHAGTTIALFGHFPDRELAERAAEIARQMPFSPEKMERVANSATTGMRYIYEMDFGFGGALRSAPPHPGIESWRYLVEQWSSHSALSPLGRLSILTAAADLGSEQAKSDLEAMVLGIEDYDAEEWKKDDKDLGHALGNAVRRIQKRSPALLPSIVEKVLASSRYNIASRGIDALEAVGTESALRRLIDFHALDREWHLRDTAANTIELLAARLGIGVRKVRGRYRLPDGDTSPDLGAGVATTRQPSRKKRG